MDSAVVEVKVMMATNNVDMDYAESSSSCADTGDNSASESSDFSDCDVTLLENADDIMEKISPKKSKTANVKKKCKTGATDNKRKVVAPRKKQLSKAEILQIASHLEKNESSITTKTVDQLNAKCFWDSHRGYRQSLSMCESHEKFTSMIIEIIQDFRELYVKNHKGSTKYDGLQLEWFQNAAKYLKNTDNQITPCLDVIAESVDDRKHFRSCVISNIHSIVFAICCSEVIAFSTKKQMPKDKPKEYKPDEEYALYKTHGWVLHEMKRHVNLKSCGRSNTEKEVWKQIQDTLVCKDKTMLPSELHHLDKGLYEGMTFPSNSFLPFMRLADVAFKEFTSGENQRKFGNKIAVITKMQMHAHVGLKEEFSTVVTSMNHDVGDEMIDAVFKFWIEKLCNMRIKDTIIVAAEKLELSESKKITSKSQNLRDKLLTKHTDKK